LDRGKGLQGLKINLFTSVKIKQKERKSNEGCSLRIASRKETIHMARYRVVIMNKKGREPKVIHTTHDNTTYPMYERIHIRGASILLWIVSKLTKEEKESFEEGYPFDENTYKSLSEYLSEEVDIEDILDDAVASAKKAKLEPSIINLVEDAYLVACMTGISSKLESDLIGIAETIKVMMKKEKQKKKKKRNDKK